MQEALLGAKIEIPTLSSTVRIQIPAGVRNGQKMRLRSRGIPKKKGGHGDLYLVLRPTPPEGSSEQLRALAEKLEQFYPSDGLRNNFTLK
jgi:curved DNA-binding protein